MDEFQRVVAAAMHRDVHALRQFTPSHHMYSDDYNDTRQFPPENYRRHGSL